MFSRYHKLISVVLFSLLLFGWLGLTPSLLSQEENERPAAKEKPKKESPKKNQTQELEGDRFMTPNDKVRLSVTYHFGNADKDTAPVLLLHDLHGSRKDFAPLITMLSNNNYAILAADLRGHGKSVKRLEFTPPKIEMQAVAIPRNNNSSGRGQKPKIVTQPVVTAPAAPPKLVEYLVDDFQIVDYEGMIKDDLPYLREMLEKVHNEGLVNINRLTVIGIGYGATLAAYWTTQDWKDKDSDRFTKTLIMIAPTETNPINPRGDMSKAFSNNKWMRNNLAVLFAVPTENTSSQSVAEKIRTALLEKNEDEKIEANFQIFNYPTTKAAKTDKEESKTEMTIAETFSSGLGKAVLNFIDKRNQELEIRWSKLK